MKNKSQLDLQIKQSKHNLQTWISQNKQLLLELQQTSKINQQCTFPDTFMSSRYLKMFKLMKKKCQLCHYNNNFKFIRNKELILYQEQQQEGNCSIFLLCESCYHQKDGKISIVIDRSCYQSMDSFLLRVQNANRNLQMEPKDYDLVYQKYDYFEKKLHHTLNQIDKVVYKCKLKICHKLRYQIDFLKTLVKKKGYHEIDDLLFKTQSCNCLYNCCYCDYGFANDQFLKKNCKYYDLKSRQNELIKKVNLLNIISKDYTEKYQIEVFDSIIKQIETILMKNMFPIEQNLKKIQKQCQNISISMQNSINDIMAKYQLFDLQNLQNQTVKKNIVEECALKYQQKGVINHMTCHNISAFSKEATTITLHKLEDEQNIKDFLPKFLNLNRLYIQNNEIGSFIIKDSIKSLTQPQEQTINLNKFNHLESISFNCKIDYSKQLFDSMNDMKALKQFYFNWNFYQSLQKLNQSSHFLQDKIFINSNAPAPKDIKNLYSKYQLSNLWMGKCGRKVLDQFQESQVIQDEIVDYADILKNNGSKLEGIMFGQFDGISRIIDSSIYQQINTRQNIKAVYLNKIQITIDMFKMFLRQNNNSLEVLYFNSCENINQIFQGDIYQLNSLKKLGIIQIRNIKFTHSIPSLQTFILQHCYDYFDDSLVTFLSKSKLRHLSFHSCAFLSDHLCKSIIKDQITNGNALETLILGYTRITNQTLHEIDKLQKLKCLDIGGTNIDLSKFMQDLSQNKIKNISKIQKLSLKEMKDIKEKLDRGQMARDRVSEYYNDVFSSILSCFPILSHLDISYNEIINERAIRFQLPYLTYLTITESKYKLRTKALRKDHSGLYCPFLKGNLSLKDKNIQQIKQISEQEQIIVQPQFSDDWLQKNKLKHKEFIKIIL